MSLKTARNPFGGIYAATICPLTPEGAVDETALARHLTDVLAVDGVVGLLVNGHAGENFAMDPDELKAVIGVARAVAGPARIVAGLNAERAGKAARLAEDAARAGADAVMVFPPYSWALGADDRMIQAHHRTVDAATDLPIFLFQGAVQAARTAFGNDTLSRLLEIESVVGIKEGSWETAAYDRTRRLAANLRPDVGVMASGDEHLFACFAIGSEGSLVSLAAVVPELIVALDRAVLNGDLITARVCHDRLYTLARLVYGAPGHLATLRLKTCLQMLGRLECVTSRSPIERLGDIEQQQLRAALVAAEVL
jgi:4-hydroxy-tetrahydrodipicolinate synthase